MPRKIPFEILPADCIFKSVRSRGPGGQNVNKTSTAVQLFFSVKDSSLPQELKDRIAERYGRRMTSDGVLALKAQGERTQELNRRAVLLRLREMIERVAVIPEVRRLTRPTRASQERRLEQKAIRSSVKRSRAAVTAADD
jgi:ribosome-associated protein